MIVPPTVILPAKYATSSVVFPVPTYKLYSDLAVVPIPTFLKVLTPTSSDAQVPAPPTLPAFATHLEFDVLY